MDGSVSNPSPTNDSAPARALRRDEICERFEAAWQSGARPQIEDFLAQAGGDDPATLLRDLLAIEWERRAKLGEHPVQEEYRARFPQHEQLVAEMFKATGTARDPAPDATTDFDQAPPSEPGPRVPAGADATTIAFAPPRAASSGQRFRIVRAHAKGGLGQVSLALDEELHREVAFKELLVHCADDAESRARFVCEAEVTGSLEHPGVVPVYALGYFPDGRPYYAMRFIRGESLKEAIARFHQAQWPRQAPGQARLELRKLLRHFIDVCHAVQYAHSRGVLHRDLKPSNIMLGKFGETLVVDWGLAKVLGQAEPAPGVAGEPLRISASGEVAATCAGRVMGTPAYMSPEQAAGNPDVLGPASDIYSLGAILYHLLANRPPFQGDHLAAVVDRVLQGDYPPPRAIRPQIPRPLEAVCLKAMALEPGDRYPSAMAMAEDVEHWLADEPVSAHRERWPERIGRWMRRHRTWTQAGAAALCLVAVVAVAATVLINRARQQAVELAEQNRHLAEQERRARGESLSRLREARSAVDLWLTGAAEALKYTPGAAEARKRLLQQAAGDYQRFADHASDDFELEAERGRILLRLGDVRRLLGESVQAEEAYRAAIALLEDLGRAHPDARNCRLEAADSGTKLGLLLADTGRHQEADQAYAAAVAHLRPLVEAAPQDPRFRESLATALLNHGTLLSDTGARPRAELTLRESCALWEKLTREGPEEARLHVGLAAAWDVLGRRLADEGHSEEALLMLRQAAAQLDRLAGQGSARPQHLESRASTRVCLASVLRAVGRYQEELDCYRKAAADYENLDRTLPDVPLYRESLALTRTDLAGLLHHLGRNVDAERELGKALPIFTRLAADFPQVPRYQEELAAARDVLGQVLGDLARPREARLALEPAVETYERLAKLYADVPQYRERQAVAKAHLGRVLHNLGERPAAAEALRSAIKTLEDLVRAEPKVASYPNEMAFVLGHQGTMLIDLGDRPQAEKAFVQARQTWQGLVEQTPSAEYRVNLANLLADCPLVSLRDPKQAVALARSAREEAPANASYWGAEAVALYRAGDWKASVDALREAMRLRGDDHARDCFFLAMAQHQLGQKGEAVESYRRALKAFETNARGSAELDRIRREAAQLLDTPERLPPSK